MITEDEEDQEQMARNVFHMIDKNGKGAIQTEDLREAFDGVTAARTHSMQGRHSYISVAMSRVQVHPAGVQYGP